VAAKPPPSHAFEQVALPAAEESGEYFYNLMIRRARESIIFQPVREGFSSEYAFLARWLHFSVSLTSPSGRKYITGVVKQGNSSVGAGIRGVTKKGNTYPSAGTWGVKHFTYRFHLAKYLIIKNPGHLVSK